VNNSLFECKKETENGTFVDGNAKRRERSKYSMLNE
jgi:hypothetical protein